MHSQTLALMGGLFAMTAIAQSTAPLLCDPTLRSPAPHGLRCGVEGSLTRGKVAKNALIGTFNEPSLEKCAAECESSIDMATGGSNCIFFAIKDAPANDGTFTCNLYSKNGGQMGAKKDTSTGIFLYNQNCFTSECPDTTAGCTVQLTYTVDDNATTSYQYTQYFKGTGVVEDSANPPNAGNSNPMKFPPVPVQLDSDLGSGDCNAAAFACAQTASNQANGGYYSFDVHYDTTLPADGAWMCIAYYNGNDDVAAFTVTDTNVTNVYGYSLVPNSGSSSGHTVNSQSVDGPIDVNGVAVHPE